MSMKFSTLLILQTCFSAVLGQTNSSFYVATTGNDSNPGTPAAPWRTIQHAADTARAGSTVHVRGGVYEELVSINVIGAGSQIELLKNNIHHIENNFEGRDAPGSGGNGFGIAVYGTDAKTP